MAKIYIPADDIQRHLDDGNFDVVNISWSKNGFGNEPEVEIEVTDDMEVEVDEDSYVEAEQYQKVVYELEDLNEQYIELKTAYDKLVVDHQELQEEQTNSLTNRMKSWFK